MTSRRWLLVVSVGIHLALVSVFLVTGMWRIDRLDAGRLRGPSLAVMQPLEAAGGSAPAATPSRKPPPTPPRPVTHVHVQPQVVPPIHPPIPDVATVPGDGSGTGSGSGSAAGSGAGSGSGIDPLGACAAPPCGVPVEVKPPVVITIETVPPRAIAALRISGDTQVHPSEVDKTEIARDGRDKVVTTFKICLSDGGAVTSVRLLTASTYPDYVARLTAAVSAWRYRPYVVNGRAVAVCSVVTFDYAIHD